MKMNPILRNILSILAGVVLGSIVNMGIIMISGSIILPPEGADATTMEGLKASMHLFQPQHFIMPFLAHALGTFTGALLAGFLAANNKMRIALSIGIFFLIGGITNIMMLPSPLWFSVVDIVGAYVTVAYLAGRLVTKKS